VVAAVAVDVAQLVRLSEQGIYRRCLFQVHLVREHHVTGVVVVGRRDRAGPGRTETENAVAVDRHLLGVARVPEGNDSIQFSVGYGVRELSVITSLYLNFTVYIFRYLHEIENIWKLAADHALLTRYADT
jgi:hypothetical protein